MYLLVGFVIEFFEKIHVINQIVFVGLQLFFYFVLNLFCFLPFYFFEFSTLYNGFKFFLNEKSFIKSLQLLLSIWANSC